VGQKDLHKSTGSEAAHTMLGKLSRGVNFTNILQAAFACKDPKSAKIQ